MEQKNKPYEGLKCENCCYWFSKMYLFKQHYRRCHSNLGQLIDLPSLPFFSEMVMQNNLQEELYFAILHLSPRKPVLMRIFEAETHATMRIANVDDIREQKRRLAAKAVQDSATIPVLYDVYSEISAEGNQSFRAVPKQKLERVAHKPFPTISYFPTDIYPSVGENQMNFFDDIVLFNHNLSNPMSDFFEDIVNDL